MCTPVERRMISFLPVFLMLIDSVPPCGYCLEAYGLISLFAGFCTNDMG